MCVLGCPSLPLWVALDAYIKLVAERHADITLTHSRAVRVRNPASNHSFGGGGQRPTSALKGKPLPAKRRRARRELQEVLVRVRSEPTLVLEYLG